VNNLVQKLDADTHKSLLNLGFKYKKGFIEYSNSKEHFELFSFKTSQNKVKDEIYRSALNKLRHSDKFIGIIEAETAPIGFTKKFNFKKFRPSIDFPIFEFHFIEKNKGSDIHIYRHHKDCHDFLDKLLLQRGFFEVIIAHKRIWNLELSSFKETKEIYEILIEYFEICGGIIELECEVVNKIDFSRNEFAKRQVVMSFI